MALGPARPWSPAWTRWPAVAAMSLSTSVGWVLGEREKTALRLVQEQAWQIAIDGRDEVRQHRADEACAACCCAHRACWIEEAHVTELTGLLREGSAGDQLAGWPEAMRIFARREGPHRGAKLTLLEAEDGWRYSLRDHEPACRDERLAGPERLHRRRSPGPRPGRGHHLHRQGRRPGPLPVLRQSGRYRMADHGDGRADPAGL